MLRFIVMSCAVTVCISALIAGSEPQNQVQVIQQNRNINSWVWIGGCPQQVQNAAATNFDPFVASVAAEPACELGEGAANASQTSEILSNGFSATGAGHFSIGSPQYVVIHSSARSQFDVTFTLPERQRFTLTGTIAAARVTNGPSPGAMAFTSLYLSSGATNTGDLFSRMLNPPPNQPAQEEISATGFIQAGTNRIAAQSYTFADQAFDELFVDTDVSFDIDVVFTHPADVSADGVVNVADLLAVLNAWGVCPAPPGACLADIAPEPAGDGMVNVADMLMILNNWG